MKRKYFTLGIVLFFLLFITGCGTTKEKTMTCTRSMNKNGIKTNLTYKVIYQNNYVNKVHSEEVVETEAGEILENYKKQVENMYKAYKGIKYYNYDIKVNENRLTSIVDIDYSKIDTKKLIEIDSSNGNIIKNGKIKVQDIKSLYEQLGTTCKE